MTILTRVANDIFAPVTEDGQPRGAKMQEVQVWGMELESVITAFLSNGGLIYATKAAMDADAATYSEPRMAWVLGDPTVANNGIYRLNPTANIWIRAGDLPYGLIKASDIGAGLPNAIVATSVIPVSEGVPVIMRVFEANTSSPVTVTFNGGATLQVRTASGSNVPPGGLPGGMYILGVADYQLNVFRLLTDIASTAIQVAAEVAQVAAEAAAEQAEGWAGAANPDNFVPIRPNLCPNGGAERGTAGMTAWNETASIAATVSVLTSEWGTYWYLPSPATAVYSIQWEKFGVVPGHTYTISGDVQLIADTGSIGYFDIVWFDASGTAIGDGNQSATGPGDFSDTTARRQALASASVAPAGAAYGCARCVFNATNPTVLAFRRVKVERGALPASFYSSYNYPRVRPSYWPVSDWGILPGNTAAQNTARWSEMKAEIEAFGRAVILLFDSGTYDFAPISWPNVNGVRAVGIGKHQLGTRWRFNNATGNCVTISGTQYPGIRDIYFTSSVRRTADFYISIEGDCFETSIEHVRFDYGWNGLWIKRATESRVVDISGRYMHGSHIILYGGAAGGCYRATLRDIKTDNPYPVGTINPRGARVASTAYAVGDVVSENSRIWQCVTAGTSASGAGPSATPGTGAADAFTAAVVDGSAAWKFVSRLDLTAVTQDSYGYSLVLSHAALLNGAVAYRMSDTLATGSSFPQWCFADNIECDHNWTAGIDLTGGEGFFCPSLWAGSCLMGNGININAGFRGEGDFTGGRVHGNGQHGILLQAGPKAINLSGLQIGLNSQRSAGAYNGIQVAAGASDFLIVNNRSGINTQSTFGSQGYGIGIADGCSNFVVALNGVRGNVTGNLNTGAGHTNGNFSVNY